MTILGIIGFGFFFGVGLGLVCILFQVSFLILKQIYISYIVRQITKKAEPKKPKGMEFGELND